jgi:diacylglycerol kinase (ATP)
MMWLERNFSRLLWATRYSIAGLKIAWRHEQAFRQELAVFIFIVPAAFWFGRNGVERSLLIGSWLLVLIVELLNTAIEAAIDRIGTERHELAGRAKDLGSAGVFCSIALAAIVWLLVLFG